MVILKTIPLGLSALVFAVMLVLRFRGLKKASLYLSLSLLMLISLSYLLYEHYKWIIPSPALEPSFLTIKTLWWFSVAYVVTALLKWGFYECSLTFDGDSTIPLLIQHLITILIYMVTLMIVLRFVFDQSITAIATASGAIALLLGYSSRTVLDELFSGLALFANAPFEKGDLIQIGDDWGYVKDMNWRAITYMDMDESYVMVPNTTVAASKIRNLDRPSKLTRRTFFFTAEFNIPPKVIIEESEAAMKDCPHIADHPWNSVVAYSFEKTGMQYKVHFYIEHYNFWYVASDELINSMWYRFSRKGIRFGHQRHLNYTTEKDEKKGLSKSAYDKAAWDELFERFSHVPIFDGMTDTDMEDLVKSAPLHVIGPPESIARSGALHSSMFLIVSGAVDLFEVDRNGVETFMAEAGAFEYVGLMSLLTGDPQRTTIRAKMETVICEITSDALHALFKRRPDVMEKIAKSVAKWQREEDEALRAIVQNRQLGATQIKAQTKSISDRIIAFFNLRDE